MRIAWGITGAGDYLEESMEVMASLSRSRDIEVTALVSKNGVLVLKMYKLWDRLKSDFDKVMVEKGPNQPFIAGRLQTGYYDIFFVSPATANTVAKLAHGIADSLISNCVAQCCKGGTPVVVYPVDQKPGVVTTTAPNGKRVEIGTRHIDLDNAGRLKGMEGMEVVAHPSDIRGIVKRISGGQG
jgi:archaeoflavoprotein AfpA